jgi:hypothetical protein
MPTTIRVKLFWAGRLSTLKTHKGNDPAAVGHRYVAAMHAILARHDIRVDVAPAAVAGQPPGHDLPAANFVIGHEDAYVRLRDMAHARAPMGGRLVIIFVPLAQSMAVTDRDTGRSGFVDTRALFADTVLPHSFPDNPWPAFVIVNALAEAPNDNVLPHEMIHAAGVAGHVEGKPERLMNEPNVGGLEIVKAERDALGRAWFASG